MCCTVRGRLGWGLAVLISLLFEAACSRQSNPQDNEALLAQHRNLGKAFYENPTTKQEAVQEFQQALAHRSGFRARKTELCARAAAGAGHETKPSSFFEEVQRQDPSLPHTWFNLGIYYKRQGDANRAIAQFEGMIARAPVSRSHTISSGRSTGKPNRNTEAQTQFETRRGSRPATGGRAVPALQSLPAGREYRTGEPLPRRFPAYSGSCRKAG